MARNLPDPSDSDAWLEGVKDPTFASIAIRSENCPVKAMEKAIELHPNLESQIVYNSSCPSHILEQVFSRAPWGGTRSTIVQHKNATEEIFAAAVGDPDDYVRMKIAESTKNKELLSILATHLEDLVRVGVARNTNTPAAALKLLLNPFRANIAAAVATNPNCTDEIFNWIAAQPITDGGWIPDALLSRAPASMLADLVERTPVAERYYLLKNQYAPEELLLSVLEGGLKEGGFFAFNQSLQNFITRPHISDELFIAALGVAGEGAYSRFALSSHITPATFAAMVALKSVDVKVYLAQNSHVSGDLLMELLKDKSKKIKAALDERTYYAKNERGEWTRLPFVGREALWAALESSVSAAPKKKKMNQKIALEQIFSSTMNESEFEAITRAYKKSGAIEFTQNNDSELLAAGSTVDQRSRIYGCVLVRAAQLKLIPVSDLRKKENLNAIYRVEGATLDYAVKPFLESFDDLNFEIISELGELRRIIGAYVEITKISERHIKVLIGLGEPFFNWKVANQYPLTQDLLVLLASSPAYRHSTYQEDKEKIGLAFGEWSFYASNGYRVESHPAAIVAVNPLTPPEIVEKLKKSSNQYIRGLFIEDERLFSNVNLIKGMKDKSEHVRALVASHPDATHDMLEKLATDKAVEVRTAVKSNPKTPAEIKAMMALLKD